MDIEKVMPFNRLERAMLFIYLNNFSGLLQIQIFRLKRTSPRIDQANQIKREIGVIGTIEVN